MKKGAGSVSSFTDRDGKTYKPGDIVDLPEEYAGEKWLEPVKEEPEKKTVKTEDVKAEVASEPVLDVAESPSDSSPLPGLVEPAPEEAEENREP